MAKNLIHIFGASGSGTTTLAEKISRELGYFHLDTDDYFWLPPTPNSPPSGRWRSGFSGCIRTLTGQRTR